MKNPMKLDPKKIQKSVGKETKNIQKAIKKESKAIQKKIVADVKEVKPVIPAPNPKKNAKKEIKEKRKEVYQGEVRKCPNCGNVLNTFDVTCSLCGYDLRNVQSSQAVKDFCEKLKKIESKRKSKNALYKITRRLRIFEPDPTDRKISDLVRTCVIPNTKEDIYEFMVLATSNIDYRLTVAYDYADTLIPYDVSVRYSNELFLKERHAKQALEYADAIMLWVKTIISEE